MFRFVNLHLHNLVNNESPQGYFGVEANIILSQAKGYGINLHCSEQNIYTISPSSGPTLVVLTEGLKFFKGQTDHKIQGRCGSLLS